MTEIVDRAIVAAYKNGGRLVEALPAVANDGAARMLAAAMAIGSPARRRMVARHMQRVHGDRLRGVALQRSVQRVFVSYARYWLEALALPSMEPIDLEAAMTVTGVDQIHAALEAGTGAILTVPHLGGWDFGGAFLAACRNIPITVVVEPLNPPELLQWFTERRERWGVTVVPLGPDAGKACLGALKKNGCVVLFSDRDLQGGGIEVDFFGETTTLPAGPATLALRSGAPLFPTAVYYGGARGHRGVVEPPLDTARRGKFRADVERVTQDMAHALERLIEAAPEQWHLLQPNWPSDRDGRPVPTLSSRVRRFSADEPGKD